MNVLICKITKMSVFDKFWSSLMLLPRSIKKIFANLLMVGGGGGGGEGQER